MALLTISRNSALAMCKGRSRMVIRRAELAVSRAMKLGPVQIVSPVVTVIEEERKSSDNVINSEPKSLQVTAHLSLR